MLSFQRSFDYAYYAHVCTTIWVLGNDFKNEIEKAVTTHPANTLSNLESFRLVHLKVSGLIGQINTLLKWNFSFRLCNKRCSAFVCSLYRIAQQQLHLDFNFDNNWILIGQSCVLLQPCSSSGEQTEKKKTNILTSLTLILRLPAFVIEISITRLKRSRFLCDAYQELFLH